MTGSIVLGPVSPSLPPTVVSPSFPPTEVPVPPDPSVFEPLPTCTTQAVPLKTTLVELSPVYLINKGVNDAQYDV
jgi:hypothetical protein